MGRLGNFARLVKVEKPENSAAELDDLALAGWEIGFVSWVDCSRAWLVGDWVCFVGQLFEGLNTVLTSPRRQ